MGLMELFIKKPGKKHTLDKGERPAPGSVDALTSNDAPNRFSAVEQTSFDKFSQFSLKKQKNSSCEDEKQRFINDREETSVESEPRSASLLNDVPWVKLVEGLVKLQETFGRQRKKLPSEAQEALDYASEKIDELLLCNGLKRIDDEPKFNRVRHQCASGQIVEDGTLIAETLTPGLYLDDRVFKRAQVVIDKEQIDE